MNHDASDVGSIDALSERSRSTRDADFHQPRCLLLRAVAKTVLHINAENDAVCRRLRLLPGQIASDFCARRVDQRRETSKLAAFYSSAESRQAVRLPYKDGDARDGEQRRLLAEDRKLKQR